MVNIPMLSAPSSTNTSMVVDTITKDSPTTSNSLFDNIFGDTTNNSSIDDSLFNDLFGDTTNNSGIDNSNTSIDNSNTTNNNTPAIIGTAYISVKNSLRVRAGTSFNTTIVAYIYRNQEIEVLDTNIPNWSHIQFRTAKGTIRE